ALGSPLDRRLERLGKAKADPRRELLGRHPTGVTGGVDEDELGLLAREAHLDVAGGQLRRELDRRLRQHVEQLQPQVRRKRVAEALGDLRRALVSQFGETLQILLQPLEDDRQVHCDITMTSQMGSVKCQSDDRSASLWSDAAPPGGRGKAPNCEVRCDLPVLREIRGTTVAQPAESSTVPLRASRELLELVLAHLVDGVLVVAASGARVYANAEAARLTGYPSPEALLGAPRDEAFQRFEV